MKVFLLIATALLGLTGISLSQCPAPGLKILSATCEDPKNLGVDSVSCSVLQVHWTGGKAQGYLVKAIGTDALTGEAYEAKVSSACDENGRCRAVIAVREGSGVVWSVQAVCSISGAALYSNELTGTDTRIPVCRKTTDQVRAIHIYPNPANDYLMVQYDGAANGAVQFRVLDITGKKQFSLLDGTSVKANNSYSVDVRNLPPGMYLLEAASGLGRHQQKFIILRN